MKTTVCQHGACTKKTRARDGFCREHKPMPWAVIAQSGDITSVTLHTCERNAVRGAAFFAKLKAGNRAEAVRVVSWKPVFKMANDPTWYDNAQRFASYAEAKSSAHARFVVWTMPENFDAHPSPDPVNYRRVNGHDECLSLGD